MPIANQQAKHTSHNRASILIILAITLGLGYAIKTAYNALLKLFYWSTRFKTP